MLNLEPAEVGQFIAHLRKKKGWEQTDLAAKLGVSQPRVSEMENYGSGLALPRLVKLSEVFEMELSQFFSKAQQFVKKQRERAPEGMIEMVYAPCVLGEISL